MSDNTINSALFNVVQSIQSQISGKYKTSDDKNLDSVFDNSDYDKENLLRNNSDDEYYQTADGQTIIRHYENDDKTAYSEYFYDENGNKTSQNYFELNENGDPTYMAFDDGGDGIADGSLEIEYFDDGSRKKYYDDDLDGNPDECLEFDKDGNRTKRIVYGSGEYGNQTSEFVDVDKDGNDDYCNVFDENGELVEYLEYSYDEENNTRDVLVDYGANGDFDSETVFNDNNDTKTFKKFKYDENGELVGRYVDKNGDGFYDFYEELNEDGEVTKKEKLN